MFFIGDKDDVLAVRAQELCSTVLDLYELRVKVAEEIIEILETKIYTRGTGRFAGTIACFRVVVKEGKW